MPKQKTPKIYTGTEISVTERDIARGTCRSGQECAVALAVRRAVHSKKVDICSLLDDAMTINDVNYTMPKRAVRFIERFDETSEFSQAGTLPEAKAEAKKRRAKLKPFTFKVGKVIA